MSFELPGRKNYPWVYEIVEIHNETAKIRNITYNSNSVSEVHVNCLTVISNNEILKRLKKHAALLKSGQKPPGRPPKNPFNLQERIESLELKRKS